MSASKHFRSMAIALTMALPLSGGSLFAADQHTHKHEHGHATAPAKLMLNNGKKWGTDEALRRGMENIRNAMATAQHRIHEGQPTRADDAALAGKLNGELAAIVANCKLEAQADAQLHLVLADIAEGIATMEGKAEKRKRQGGARKILDALEQYGRYFDHPDWQAITH